MSDNPSSLSEDDVTGWLVEHGDVLFRFAMARLGSRETAEDLVQDTFLAALRSHGQFQGRSAVQTWLVGILRHKIADHLRSQGRQRKRDAAVADQQAAESPFRGGHWRVGIGRWPRNPPATLEDREFWQVLASCQERLPGKLAVVFRMRELEERPMAEICKQLEISATNLSVRLHRARLLLRDCLDRHWFSGRSA